MSDSPYTFPPAQAPRTGGPVEPGSNGAGVRQQALTDRMAQGAHHTIDRLAETAAPHVERLEEALSGAGVRLKNQAQRVRETGDEWADGLRTTVRRNPLTAVAAALAIGALISRITR
jgi:ElaB/YqjD/DUF883 family membrane-anchored ribosome-binding protein